MTEVIITPLGTVSPYPKDNMNCPGFLIENNDYRVLLDCGEGVSRQIDMVKDLNNLIVIISHLHKDHYSGLSGLAYASYVYKNLGYLSERVKVYIPSGDKTDNNPYHYEENGWGEMIRVDNNLQDYDYLMNYGNENYLEFIPYQDNYSYHEVIEHGKMRITFCRNLHNLVTYSIKITVDDLVVVYSSDTGYEKKSLTNFSKEADLLICEATFLRGQTRIGNNHLYAYEAGKMAKEANVNKLVLTHFWPEIDKELYVKEAKHCFKNTEAAYEGKKLILRK